MTDLTARERVTYAIRAMVAHALYYTGILHLLQRVILRRRAVVLMYHRVLSPEQRRQTASHPGLVVECATFARQVALLKRRFTVLTLDEFEQRLISRTPFTDSCCLITFDDGWIDNYSNALPVLRANGLPAAIFLPVNFIGNRRLFTREALTHLLVRAVMTARREPARAPALRERLAAVGLESALEIRDEDPRHATLSLMQTFKFASGPQFESLVAALSSEFAVTDAELSELDTFIDWAQVAAMSQARVTFGGHGAEHRVLTQTTAEVVQYEVESCKTILDQRLSAPAQAFAYPGGGWNAAIAETVKRAGYRLAFTIEPGYVSCEDDRFALRRVNIHEGMTRSTPMFMARLVGLF